MIKDYEILIDKIDKLIFSGEYIISKSNNKLFMERFIKEEYTYFDEFIDTSRMSSGETFDFIFTDKILSHKNNRNYLAKIICNDNKDYVSYFNYNKSDYNDEENFKKIFDNKDNNARKLYRDFAKAMIFTEVLTKIMEQQFFSLLLKEELNSKNLKLNKNVYYRGQMDYSWNLQPSFLRGFKSVSTIYDGCLINREKLFEIYNKIGLIDKYNNTIGNNSLLASNNINYEFLSFMQHAVPYSPLIDFTSDENIALIFALDKSNPNCYLFNDSALFQLYIDNNDELTENEVFNKFKIYFLNKKIKPGQIMKVSSPNGRINLDFTSIDKIIKYLTPNFHIFNQTTNDRMKYQKGKFIMFYDCVSVKGNIYYSLNKKLHLFKERIKVKDKNNKREAIIKNNPNLIPSYLMSPYTIFND